MPALFGFAAVPYTKVRWKTKLNDTRELKYHEEPASRGPSTPFLPDLFATN